MRRVHIWRVLQTNDELRKANSTRGRLLTAELLDEEAQRIASSRMDLRYEHLNALLDDKPQPSEAEQSR